MDWSPEQEQAIASVLRWFHDLGGRGGVFRLFGYAGTGKTTIAKEIAAAIGGTTIFAAFTGKAALVLSSKGCHGARTVHSLIYLPREKCSAALQALSEEIDECTDEDRKRELLAAYAVERENLKRPAFNLNLKSELRDADLLILDEVSMIDMQIGQDLESFDVPILALGDPAQLPPVRGQGYFTQAQPDFLLEQIHRQAEGSPILAMATAVRQGRILNYREGDEAEVVPRGTYDAHGLAEFDQVICGRNKTRRTINRHIRTKVMEVETPLPVIGDRIVCLRNDGESGLLNGSQWDVNGVEDDPDDEDRLILTIAAAGDPDAYTFDVKAHKHYFLGTEDELPHYEVSKAQCFDYAYALTCHKAQGSQWERVAIINESECFRADQHKWLYTAVTRAAKKVTVIQ